MKKMLSALILLSVSTLGFAQNNNGIDEDIAMLEQGQLENLALTQYYRWFLAFESKQNRARLDNHLTLVSDDVKLLTAGGPAEGKEGMLNFLAYVDDWQNAHHIEAVDIERNKDGSIKLEADIEYQNILPDGQVNGYKLHYKTNLKTTKASDLPIFTELELLPFESLEKPVFENAYVKNRALSFVSYWSYLLDNIDGNEDQLKSLLATSYKINFDGKNDITNTAQVDQWLGFMKSSFSIMLHNPKDVTIVENKDGTLAVSLNMDWKGLATKGDRMTLKTHHEWLLSNDKDDLFPKLVDLKMTEIQPFTVVESF